MHESGTQLFTFVLANFFFYSYFFMCSHHRRRRHHVLTIGIDVYGFFFYVIFDTFARIADKEETVRIKKHQ